METEKMVCAGITIILVVLGISIATLFLTFDPGASNNGGTGLQDITPNTDMEELNLTIPNWSLLMSDGEYLEMHSLFGYFVVVDLMQTGDCIPCQTQTSNLKDLYEDYEGIVEILSLSLVLSDTVDRVADFKSDSSIPWIVGLDTGGVFGSYFNAQSVPTLIIIDDDGLIRWLHIGTWSNEDIGLTLARLY
ncbi:MAG: TlpA disulfide reductase family protein [Candidatus Thorarchaeota archaeon]